MDTTITPIDDTATANPDAPAEAEAVFLTWVEEGRVGFAAFKPDAMKRLFFVSTYEDSDPDSPAPRKHGYQREPMKERVKPIARYYLDNEHQFLITPLIVSVRLSDEEDIEEFVRLFALGEFSTIHRKWHKGVVSIVDGQHRYLGAVEARNLNPDFNPWVPVMFYFDLDYLHEAELFDIINTTARKLPKALIEVTKGDITEAGDPGHAQQVRAITFALARDKDSVWHNDINMTGARDPDRKVTYEGLRRSTSNMFSVELLSRLKAKGHKPEQVAKSFWSMVSTACATAWNDTPRTVLDPATGDVKEEPVDYRLKELVGVASVAKLGRDIVTSALEHEDFDGKMAELVSMLSEVDWEKRDNNPWVRSQAGMAGQKELYTMLYELVYLGERPGEAA